MPLRNLLCQVFHFHCFACNPSGQWNRSHPKNLSCTHCFAAIPWNCFWACHSNHLDLTHWIKFSSCFHSAKIDTFDMKVLQEGDHKFCSHFTNVWNATSDIFFHTAQDMQLMLFSCSTSWDMWTTKHWSDSGMTGWQQQETDAKCEVVSNVTKSEFSQPFRVVANSKRKKLKLEKPQQKSLCAVIRVRCFLAAHHERCEKQDINQTAGQLDDNNKKLMSQVVCFSQSPKERNEMKLQKLQWNSLPAVIGVTFEKIITQWIWTIIHLWWALALKLSWFAKWTPLDQRGFAL